LASSVATSVQTPLQAAWPLGQHLPLLHTVPPVQALLQAPQLALSLPVTFTQPPLQATVPIEQAWQVFLLVEVLQNTLPFPRVPGQQSAEVWQAWSMRLQRGAASVPRPVSVASPPAALAASSFITRRRVGRSASVRVRASNRFWSIARFPFAGRGRATVRRAHAGCRLDGLMVLFGYRRLLSQNVNRADPAPGAGLGAPVPQLDYGEGFPLTLVPEPIGFAHPFVVVRIVAVSEVNRRFAHAGIMHAPDLRYVVSRIIEILGTRLSKPSRSSQ